jgi:threonine synthase
VAKIGYLECTRCGEHVSADKPATVCAKDGGSLFVRYDMRALHAQVSRDQLHGCSMWRYGPLLPDAEPVTLGEGFTPMLPSREFPNVFIKDEGLNPTGSFKARGMSMAVTMARAYGLRKLAAPSAGNAASALAAYAAAAGIEAYIFMPRDVPRANLVECRSYGAHVTLVDGLISDCGRLVSEGKETEGWFDVSSLKEPFRVEGKKTMGYEVAEQLGWKLPEAIIYPTGGGVGLIGMWKAFYEIQQLGWIGDSKPKMVAVQSMGCAPIVKAWSEHQQVSQPWPNADTLAVGLRVPKAYADYLILDILRRSDGTAVAVSDDEILDAVRQWANNEGVFAAPEGAASLAAYKRLLGSGFLKPSDTVVLFNTGSGLKYLDVIGGTGTKPKPRQIGGIIGPY